MKVVNKKIKMLKNKTSRIILAAYLIIWLSSGVGAIFALRSNNTEMLRLREKVFAADKNNSGLQQALEDLQVYVTKHMNTTLPKSGDGKAIQLKYSYDRRVAEEQNRFQQETTDISQKAKLLCSSAKNETAKVECQQKYIQQNPVAPLVEVLPEQYSVEFVSPYFSFDLAGWLIILFGGLGLGGVFYKIINFFIKLYIKKSA